MRNKLSYTLDELAAKLHDSAFKSKIFGKSITFERVTDSDRAAIKWGMQQFKRGVNRIDSDDPEIVRVAALHMLVGGVVLGAHTLMSGSVNKNSSISSVTAPKGGKAQ